MPGMDCMASRHPHAVMCRERSISFPGRARLSSSLSHVSWLFFWTSLHEPRRCLCLGYTGENQKGFIPFARLQVWSEPACPGASAALFCLEVDCPQSLFLGNNYYYWGRQSPPLQSSLKNPSPGFPDFLSVSPLLIANYLCHLEDPHPFQCHPLILQPCSGTE